jgi:nitroimidazol reductase NimA-like FMN-containing flavoprotein (pyridoxamine 5'-phosphate oxidase superfamily)
VPANARYDRESLHRVLDRGLIAHVSFNSGAQPYCIPTLYARIGDRVLIHGSAASRMVRVLATGAPACLAVTILDGLVLARSVFETTVN